MLLGQPHRPRWIGRHSLWMTTAIARNDAGLGPTERRRSRTYLAWGYQTSPVLKTGRVWLNHAAQVACGPLGGPVQMFSVPTSDGAKASIRSRRRVTRSGSGSY